MAVNLSPLAGAAWQFFSDAGVPLTGGKLYTYTAGTTTPQATYTSSTGLVANSNPIILNSAGRLDNEIWLTAQTSYKFVLKTSTDVLVGTYDNIIGVNDLFNTANVVIGGALTVGTSLGVNWTGSTLGVFNGVDKVGFYSGLSGRFWITNTALTYTPNGSDVRFQVSDTSAQLHYDNIVLAGDNTTKLPNITWKALDDGTNAGADIPLLSVTCGLGIGAQFAADHREEIRFFTDDNTGTVHTAASIERANFTAGGTYSTMKFLNGTNIGNGYVVPSGTFIGTAGGHIDLNTTAGTQELRVYYGSATNKAGIGTDTSTGGVRVFTGTSAPADRMFVDSSGNVIVGASKISNGAGVLQVDGNIVPFTDATQTLGAASYRFTNLYTAPVAVASLGSASPAGQRRFVNNATSTTFAAIVAGGGANNVPVYSDGANWRIG